MNGYRDSVAKRRIPTYDKIEYTKYPLRYQKMVPDAEDPYKERPSDAGWDLTLISRTDQRSEDDIGEVNMYDTGLRMAPPEGYHIELYARSSLQKLGYMLGNNVGIIDPEYRGNILVGLYKFKEADDLELPFRGVQMILRKTEQVMLQQVPHFEETTSRGEDGFGSTGHGAPSSQHMNSQFMPNQRVTPQATQPTSRRTNIW